ncbi:kynureninase [Tropicibacter naphthalenivorans]|uniref:Kynureninase n=1 Tax=Tropicibacter naphthalenivorans TaxID=441103 RepID=A0A0P1GE89_9RHOB|nr:kynureninase [Tropicibacter naphthalenivorans]CUH80043.1 Kynureninase [Tropicibacter naphthalenivorans]SMC83699.1 Kynureninase [Tropicibacter naphthalenivorans]
MTDFSKTRDLFDLPKGVTYLDGNSLGPLPKATPARMQKMLTEEWGHHLIGAWNACDWMALPGHLGDRIGRLIGAEAGQTVIGDTLSIKVFQALAAALKLNPTRKVILSDSGNFPSDLYMAQGLVQLLGQDYELRVVAPEEVETNITDEIAVTLITEVDYRTGRRHDMPSLTAKAHANGALAIWDLAHSAGAFAPDVAAGGADFAVGCTYKYLNAGPGAPAFIYVAPRHADHAEPALAGWLGHDAPFDFDQAYRPAPGVTRMRVGTPPVLQMAALDAALDIWDTVDMEALRARSLELTDRFIAAVESTCPDLTLATPREHAQRGSQVSFRHPQGYAIMQALIAQRVIGDFRAPDILRFGFTPLYTTDADVDHAATTLATILDQRLWDTPEFQARKAVT